MRKVLFATTALVALGGVSAASADISVGGSASHNFVSGSGTGGSPGYTSDSQSMSTTVDFGLSGSNTLDNGMTVAGGIDLDEGGYDDSGWTISGDFGTIAFGGYANDSFGAMAVDVTADEATVASLRPPPPPGPPLNTATVFRAMSTSVTLISRSHCQLLVAYPSHSVTVMAQPTATTKAMAASAMRWTLVT